jgi:hypothetical protein
MNDSVPQGEETDCTEGCDHAPGFHKWEVEPNPYNSEFDTFVCDADEVALEALRTLCENKFDDLTPGDSATITIRMNHDRS